MNATQRRLGNMKWLRSEIARLEAQLEAQVAEHLEDVAVFKKGAVITWKTGSRVGKGRVVGFEAWSSWSDEPEVTYKVIQVRKDGTDGTKCNVYPYMNPTVIPA